MNPKYPLSAVLNWLRSGKANTIARGKIPHGQFDGADACHHLAEAIERGDWKSPNEILTYDLDDTRTWLKELISDQGIGEYVTVPEKQAAETVLSLLDYGSKPDPREAEKPENLSANDPAHLRKRLVNQRSDLHRLHRAHAELHDRYSTLYRGLMQVQQLAFSLRKEAARSSPQHPPPEEFPPLSDSRILVLATPCGALPATPQDARSMALEIERHRSGQDTLPKSLDPKQCDFCLPSACDCPYKLEAEAALKKKNPPTSDEPATVDELLSLLDASISEKLPHLGQASDRCLANVAKNLRKAIAREREALKKAPSKEPQIGPWVPVTDTFTGETLHFASPANVGVTGRLNTCGRCSGTGKAPAVRDNHFVVGETMPCPDCAPRVEGRFKCTGPCKRSLEHGQFEEWQCSCGGVVVERCDACGGWTPDVRLRGKVGSLCSHCFASKGRMP